MSVLDDLEAATQTAAQKAKAQRKEAEKLANMSAVEKLIRAENTAPPGLDLTPVHAFYLHCKKEPREILEARYAKELGVDPPPMCRHDWLATSTAYQFQIKYYIQMTGDAPTNIVRRANETHFSYPHGLLGRAYDADDPTLASDPEIWDDTFVVAAKPNPWTRDVAQKAFFCVEMGGEAGTAFGTLCELLQRMCELSVDHAQERAYGFFTKYVRDGLTKIRIEG